jgi:hypothetical protein
MYPIKSDRIGVTCKFGPRTYTYKGKKVSDIHKGIDLIAIPNNRNEEIVAFADGVVTAVQKTGVQYGLGCFVRIKHDNGYYTKYFHMKSGSIVVNIGDKVVKGQKLGIIGKTGQSTAEHLHFQIDKGSNASAIDPYAYLFNDKEFEASKQEEYPKGNYITLESMNIRNGAGANYTIKKVKDMSTNGKLHATSTDLNANAAYKKNTEFTALEILKNGNEYWAKSPSGYICLKGSSGKVYCKKK